jgi:DNA-binding transcriptional ArsR family regulator
MSSKTKLNVERVIDDPAGFKVLANPLRLRILEQLSGEGRTVKQLGQILGTQPTKLYYHVKLLEKHDFIHVTSSRMVSGIIERRYQATASSFAVDHLALSAKDAGANQALRNALTGVLDAAKADILRSVDARSKAEGGEIHRLQLQRCHARMTEEQANKFYSKLNALLEEFEDQNQDQLEGETREYRLSLALYPSLSREEVDGILSDE